MSDWTRAWRIARRELRTGFRGLRLLLLCLVLGVGAIAATGSLASAITAELAARGRVILGGDIAFSTAQRVASPIERAALERLGVLSEAIEMRSMAVRDAPGGARTVPIALKAVDGLYPLYGKLVLARAEHTKPLAAGETWIARALADRLALRTGESIRFGTARFRIAGIVADEPDRLSSGFSLGPAAIISLDGLKRTGLVEPGSLYESRYRIRLASGDPADIARRFTAAFPDGGWETRTRDRASPGTTRFVERMGEFLVLVSLAALAIAGIGVGNGVASFLAARRANLATLKVLGATSGMIARIYLIQIAFVAGAGVAGGLILGMSAVPLLAYLARDMLPVAPAFTLHVVPLAQAATYGLLIAFAFSAAPLLAAKAVPASGLLRGAHEAGHASRLQVAAAVVPIAVLIGALVLLTSARPLFSGGFLLGLAGVVAMLAALGGLIRIAAARAPRPQRPLLRLAITSLHRPGAQTVALVIALGLALTLFVLLAAIRTSIDANIARTIPARAPALFALDVPRDRIGAFTGVVRSVAPGAVVETVPLLRGTVTAYGATRVADLAALPPDAWVLRGDRGLTYSADLPDGSTITEGQWWPRFYRGPPLVSVEADQAAALGLRIGDPLTVSVLGTELTARVASFRRVHWDTMGFNFVLVFSPGAFDALPHNLSATIQMPPARADAVMQALLPRFPSVSVIEVGSILSQVRDVIVQMARAIAAAASIAILAGIAVLAGAIAAAREARTYDSVMLKVLGATRRQLLALQATEYALLAGVLATVAAMLGLSSAWYVVTQIFGFEWRPDYLAVGATLLAGIGVTMVIGLIGALPVLAVRPAAALREL